MTEFLGCILNVHWTHFVTKDEICSVTGEPLLSDDVHIAAAFTTMVTLTISASPIQQVITEFSRRASPGLQKIGDAGTASQTIFQP